MPGSHRDALLPINDRRLETLILATGEAREKEVERLIVEVARPIVDEVIARYRLRHQDADDVAATVDLRLLKKCRALPESPEEAVQDFDKYVAGLAYNAVNDHLRRAFPSRTRLKNRLRYLLTHDPRFALWSSANRLWAGLSAWTGREGSPADSLDFELTWIMRDRDRPAEALVEIFTRVDRPLPLDRLVALTAELWHVSDATAAIEEVAHVQRDDTAQLECREVLSALWDEIRVLRPMQRKALLLNLRDEARGNALLLLVLAQVATYDDLAAVLELTVDQLTDVWNDLPLDDHRTASLLGITRQQVINLRKAARARLARRMARMQGTESYWTESSRGRR